MTLTLGFNHPDYEPYTALETREDVLRALLDECRTGVEDRGSEGFDPGDFLPDFYDGEEWDPEDTAWAAAYECAVMNGALREAHRILSTPEWSDVLHGYEDEADALILGRTVVWIRRTDEDEEG